MHNDFQFIQSGIEGNDWILFTSDKQPLSSDWKNNPFFSQQLKKMVFTGLYDKNKVPIYEGDVVQRGIIVFHDGKFQGQYFGEGGQLYEMWEDDLCQEIHIEVIGNIYSNPELLNV